MICPICKREAPDCGYVCSECMDDLWGSTLLHINMLDIVDRIEELVEDGIVEEEEANRVLSDTVELRRQVVEVLDSYLKDFSIADIVDKLLDNYGVPGVED